ncbi:hypothetical protein J6O86_02930 [bacterium]|nr:hypothetical protein [bacterium]
MTIHSTKLLYSEIPEVCWYAWSHNESTVFTQIDEPETICDWIFSEPNVISCRIDEIGSNSITANGTTYTRNSTLDNNTPITAFYFTINTNKYKSGNKEFYIPIDTDNYINPINVDWGDGTQETINNTKYPTHTYENAGIYQIKISADSGCMPYIYYKELSSKQYISCDSAFLTSYKDGNIVTSWTGWEPFGFFASNLEYVASSMFYLNRKITTMFGIFGHSGLKKLPKYLFKGLNKMQRFSNTFSSTKIAEVPEGIFDEMENLNDAAFCFSSTPITKIPNKIFKYNKKIQRVEGIYQGCSKLEKTPIEILNSLFDGTDYNNYGSFSVGRVASGTAKSTEDYLTEEYLDKYIELGGTIRGCCESWLLKSIPAGIFDKYTEQTNFNACFENCANLENVPDGLFKNNINANEFQYCFMHCRKLNFNPNIFCIEETEMNTRFANCSPNFYYCFYYAGSSGSKTGSVPQLWNYSYAYADVYKKSEHTINSIPSAYRTFIDDLGDTYTYKRYLGYNQAIWESIYEWECNSDASKKYFTTTNSISTSSQLYIAESVHGGAVRKDSCFTNVGATNYSDIPKTWGGAKEE